MTRHAAVDPTRQGDAVRRQKRHKRGAAGFNADIARRADEKRCFGLDQADMVKIRSEHLAHIAPAGIDHNNFDLRRLASNRLDRLGQGRWRLKADDDDGELARSRAGSIPGSVVNVNPIPRPAPPVGIRGRKILPGH